MKKLLVTTLVVLSCGISYALPVANPSEASLLTWGIFLPGAPPHRPCHPCFYCFDLWSLRVGYYGDFVFNRNLKLSSRGFGHGKNIDQTQLFTNAGYLALNLANKADIFGSLGATKIHVTTNELSWSLLDNAVSHLDWDSTFSWSAGARGVIYSCRGVTLGVEGQYFQTSPKLIRFINTAGVPQYQYFTNTNKTTYREWQVGVGLSYALCCYRSKISLVPYFASKFAGVKFRTHNFTFRQLSTLSDLTIFNMKAAKFWGYVAGLTATFCDMACLTVEGRWGDEKALYINANYRL